MLFHHGAVCRPELGAGLFQGRAGRQPAKQLSHAMDPARHHRRRQVVWTGHHVGYDLRFSRIWDRRFQYPYYGGGTRSERPEPDGFSEHRWVALQRRGPEAIRQNYGAGGGRAVVPHVEQPSQHRMQAHHVEVRTTDHSRPHLARLSQPIQSETYGGEIAERAQRFDALPQVQHLRHGKHGILGAQATRALPDVNQPVFVAIH